MNQPIVALLDCNNFFVSCERIFNPKLENRPAVVLSNNDGCIVARSQEAKDIGLPMGAPVFKYRDMIKNNNVAMLSSNFTLYGDISKRVMSCLFDHTPYVEIYSIDEAFMGFEQVHAEHIIETTGKIRAQIQQWVGLPVSIGIAPTKTLAKIANHIAKKQYRNIGVYSLYNISTTARLELLKTIPVGDIWGIGWRMEPKLKALGIFSAYDFASQARSWVHKQMGVMGERTWLELNGTQCIELDHQPEVKRTIASTRTFGRYITNFNELAEAVASYIARAAEKLRKQNCVTGCISIYIRTNRFNQDPWYYNTAIAELATPTDSTPVLIDQAITILRQIYKPGFKYHKAGVMLHEVLPSSHVQLNLFKDSTQTNREPFMALLDNINRKWGSETMKYARQGLARTWRNKKELVSPNYTTNWDDLLEIG